MVRFGDKRDESLFPQKSSIFYKRVGGDRRIHCPSLFNLVQFSSLDKCYTNGIERFTDVPNRRIKNGVSDINMTEITVYTLM